jgi:hypothetical protein
MISEKVVLTLEKMLKFLLIAILFISALTFLFVFVINQEDWLFGIKIAGTPAGIFLLLKALVAGILFFLILRFPEQVQRITYIIITYFGFLLADSAVTIQKTTNGTTLFSPVLAGIFLIPVIFLIVHSVLRRGRNRHEGSA